MSDFRHQNHFLFCFFAFLDQICNCMKYIKAIIIGALCEERVMFISLPLKVAGRGSQLRANVYNHSVCM